MDQRKIKFGYLLISINFLLPGRTFYPYVLSMITRPKFFPVLTLDHEFTEFKT